MTFLRESKCADVPVLSLFDRHQEEDSSVPISAQFTNVTLHNMWVLNSSDFKVLSVAALWGLAWFKIAYVI